MSHWTRAFAAALLIPVALLMSAETVAHVPAATRAVDTFISASMRTAHIPGLALGVVQGDRVAYLKGYGIAGPDGRPVTPQTSFILGSTSKSFTALAVMQLVEAGKVDLDAPVTRYLQWFRTRDAAGSAQISVRHLLHHTSGLQTHEGRQGFWDNDQSSGALEKGVRELSNARLRQPPGQRFEYSNENYNTLGLIVQTVAGTSYEDYVRSAIFAPLHMSHSATALSDPAATDMASGYRYWLRWPVAFAAPYPRRMTPAGQLISSAEDLAHYVVAQLNRGTYGHSQLLSPQGIATLHAPGSKVSPTVSYGMGWAIRSAPGTTTIWHDGDESNFHSQLRLLPNQHLGIVVLMNVGGSNHSDAINGLVEGIAATLLGDRPAAPAGSVWTTISELAETMPLLVALVWAAWSFRSLRRWRGANPGSQGLSRFWRLYVPLAVDLCAVAAIWILVPAMVHAPMAAIALFAPDTFAVAVAITGVAVGCAMARIFVALRLRRVVTAVAAEATMQAMTQRAYGAPDILSLRAIARPTPGPHDVLVRVHAAGVHIGDCFGVRGTPLPMRLATGLFRPKPGIPGFDLSGIVEAVGSRVTSFRPGDAVFGASHGTCAEYVVASDVHLALKPAKLTFEQAAAMATSALAALHGLRDAGGLKRDQKVLINGAAGGIGTFAIQVAKALGAEVTGVCSTANVELVRSIGADHVIDYTREDFTRAGRQYDLIFDNVENRSLADCRRALTPNGTLVLNSGSGSRGLALLVRLLWPLVLSPFVRHNIRRFLSKPNGADLGVLSQLVDSNALRPVIDRTFPLRETAAALRYIETGHARGKVVITVK